MNEQDAHTFLKSNDNGVLSLGANNRGYGFPISYSYDEENNRIVFGFVSPPESKKREFAKTTDEATLTVYTYDDIDAWKSVIVNGTLHQIDGTDDSLHVPDVFYRDDRMGPNGEIANLNQFDRMWYELEVETVSGFWSGWD